MGAPGIPDGFPLSLGTRRQPVVVSKQNEPANAQKWAGFKIDEVLQPVFPDRGCRGPLESLEV